MKNIDLQHIVLRKYYDFKYVNNSASYILITPGDFHDVKIQLTEDDIHLICDQLFAEGFLNKLDLELQTHEKINKYEINDAGKTAIEKGFHPVL